MPSESPIAERALDLVRAQLDERVRAIRQRFARITLRDGCGYPQDPADLAWLASDEDEGD